jgi:hypothetical protein
VNKRSLHTFSAFFFIIYQILCGIFEKIDSLSLVSHTMLYNFSSKGLDDVFYNLRACVKNSAYHSILESFINYLTWSTEEIQTSQEDSNREWLRWPLLLSRLVKLLYWQWLFLWAIFYWIIIIIKKYLNFFTKSARKFFLP